MSLLLSNLNINNNQGSIVTFGNRMDVCILTLRELADAERIDRVAAERKLQGQLEGKKVVKFPYSGSTVVISMDMIHKIAEAFPKETTEHDESQTAD